MDGQRHFRVLTATELKALQHDLPNLEWKRKVRNHSSFPVATIDAVKGATGLTLNYMVDTWYVVEIK